VKWLLSFSRVLKCNGYHWIEEAWVMLRVKGRYRNQTLELEQPLALAEGTEVEIDIHLAEEAQGAEYQGWAELGMNRLEEGWDNPEDAVYDDWKKLSGV
jgi:hypothetical protein